jgi:hypothetical protein
VGGGGPRARPAKSRAARAGSRLGVDFLMKNFAN